MVEYKMSSQGFSASGADVLTLLTEAAQWSEDETLQRLSTTLAAVKSLMKKSPDTSNGIQVARFVVGSFLPHVALEDAPDVLLQDLLPQLKCFMDDIFSQCKDLAKDHVQDAQELINEVLLILETVELVMQYCMQSESIQVEKLPSLPQTVLHVVNTSLTHCQHSSTIYGEQLEAVNEVLSTLFRQTVELCSQLTNFISKLSFDVFFDGDLDILAHVCQELCATASCLSQLSEVRTSVIIWKAYTNLITTHHVHINTRLDLSPPLTALITEVTDGLNLLTQIKPEKGKLSAQDEKVIQRIMKMIYFCIKIIMVLCEKFRGYLPGAHHGLHDLLLYLHRFTSYNINLLSFPTSVKQTMDRQITIAIDPIISHLINDEDFIKMVLESNAVRKAAPSDSDKGHNADGSSYLLLLVSLLNPLSSSNTCEQYGIQVLTSLMHNMQEATLQLDLPCMVDGVMYGGRPQSKVPLYEHTLCHVCAFVARLPAQQFRDLEALLFNSLLSGTAWEVLLASDVCCFVARYGSSELCHAHVTVLLEVLAATVPLTNHSRTISQLITRLVQLMAPEDRYATCEKITKTHSDELSFPVICSILAASFPEQGIRQQLEKLLLSSVTKIIGHVKSRDITDEQLQQLIVSLCSLSNLLTCANFLDTTDQGLLAEFTYALANLWERFPHEFLGSSLVDLLLSSLTIITSVCLIHFDEQQLEQILCICEYGVAQSSESVGPSVCCLVAALGRRLVTDSQHMQILLNKLIECLVGCLRSEHPLTYQCALDAFITFGQHTKHEEVLPTCLERCGSELEDHITQYLQQQPHNISADVSSTHLLQHQQQQLENIEIKHQIVPIDLKKINYMSGQKEAEEISKSNNDLPQSDRCNKRRRSKDDNEIDTKLKSFLSSLYKTQDSMKEYKASGETVQKSEKVRISNILKELQVQWNS